ncbi:ribonuclease P protein subunit p30 [Clarias gariepinus]|uniref:ribonuclease P protein subunit p30 n=1 Tax=Clarias gariepinus TaxID=13013 RepID=UPI00234C111E|nr:ribonuclease P protein subunit p30 [Clarias gariepinus]
MSAFMDLNIIAISDKKKLQNIIETAAHLGYSTVVINYVVEQQQKKQRIPSPTPVSELCEKLPIVQGKSRPIKVLNRLTVVATDASHYRPSNEYKNFDILAVYPKTEKLFHAACMTYDVDIISIAATEKQPFLFKRSPINGAIERGVVFEISYTAAVRDSTMKKYTIANAINLVNVCKGKNVIMTSGAETALELRGPYDIANLGLVFGLSEGDAKAAISTNCRSVVLHGETRMTAQGIIHVKKKSQLPIQEPEEESPALKRAKTETL